MAFNKKYQEVEKRWCNCVERVNIPTLDHQPRCEFAKIMDSPRTHYHNLKTIIDLEGKTQEELGFLKTEVTEVKSELVEIKALLGDFLALFRSSRENE